MKKQRKRIYAALLCSCLMLSLVYTPVLAAETEQAANTHQHTEECYTWAKKCIHKHSPECYPQESVSENAATPSEAAEPIECSHVCSEESGCITKELNCQYDGSTPATAETPQENENGEETEQGQKVEIATLSNAQEIVTVESVQAMINALPDAEEISADNAEEVAEQLEAIDKAKAKLSDEEINALDFSKYMKAAAALGELSAPMLTANGTGAVSTQDELTAVLADSSISKITLMNNIDISSTLMITRAVTLDLNGYVLRMTGSGSVIQIKGGGSLTIADSNANTPHTFTPNSNGLWELNNNGTETVSGGVITGGMGTSYSSWTEGGGVYIEAQGSLVMNGGSIVGCTTMNGFGGGVFLKGENAQFTMNGDAAILGCISENGAGVCVDVGGAFIMNAGKIENCLSGGVGSYGGGVLVWDKASFRMNGGEIKNCKLTGSSSRGGGVVVGDESSFEMKGGSISGCKAWAGGGVFISNWGKFLMGGNACISDCQADKRASGVESSSGAKSPICENASIKGSVKNGGILNADGGSIEGDVNNNSEYAKITGTGAGSTEFKNGTVTNTGIIEKGVFSSDVTNGVDSDGTGTVNGGIFKGSVVNQEGALIYGGDFSQAGLKGYLVITFDPNNGDGQSTQKVDLSGNRKLTEPDPSPVKQDRALAGWYYTKNGVETKWDFINDTVQYTMTLKAGWGYQIDAAANPATGGKVDGVGVHIENTSVTLNAKANSGYRFVKWIEGGIEVSNDVNYTFTAMSNRNLVAVFEKEKQTPTAPATEAAGGSHAQDNSGSNSYIADFETGESSGSGSAAPAQLIAGDSAKTVRKDNGQSLIENYKPGSSDTPEDTEDQIIEDQSTEDNGDDQKSTVENDPADNTPTDNHSKPDDSANLSSEDNSHSGGWIPVICTSAGALVIGLGTYLGYRKRKKIKIDKK